jgi:precorrin-6B methylase 2
MPHAVRNEPKNRMRSELELIVCCTRPESSENDSRIRTLLGGQLDWNEVLALAHQHKLGPLLQERLRALNASQITPDQKDRLADLARDVGRNNLAFMGEMLWLCGIFETAGIPVFPFKGPALAWLAYKNFAHRSCVDLDFVLPQRFVPEATALLLAHGYTPEFSPAEARAGESGPAPGQYAFAPSSGRRFVELHTERTLRYFSHPINLDELNARAIHLKIGGQDLRVFSVEDLLVMLCVHGAKHFWERLSWIVDIAQLIAARDVNWDLLFGIAAKMESTRVLLLGLDLAHEATRVALPQAVGERVCGDAQVKKLVASVLEQYSGVSDPSAGVFRRAAFRVRSCDGFWQGLRQMIRLSLSPTEGDRQVMRLPDFLSPFYAVVRPFRLLGQYGLGLLRRPQPDIAASDPASREVVEHMLRMANISPEDVLYDLGCGDGRIVVAAAENYGIRAVGVDVHAARIEQARVSAQRSGVENRVKFLLSDAKNMDVSEATLVTLDPETARVPGLVQHLRSQLRPGARIVSRSAVIHGWTPDRSETHTSANVVQTELFLWTIQSAGGELQPDENVEAALPRSHKARG